jgi:diguanylate cyclase (GGDEF)-like protein
LLGADQLSAVVQAAPVALLCGIANALIITVGLWPDVHQPLLLCWLVITVALNALYLLRQQDAARDARSLSRSAMQRAIVAAVAIALPWGMLPVLYLGRVPQHDELILITICAGMAAGGGVLLAPLYPAALAYISVILVPVIVTCIAQAWSGYALLGMLTISYYFFLIIVIAVASHLSIERTQAVQNLAHSSQLLKERDALISEQNLWFETAINNMTQGLCLFDGGERLIVCNQRYLELYGLDRDRLRPGVTLRDILEMRFAAGTGPTMTADKYLAWRRESALSGTATETMHAIRSGRIFAVRYRPMTGGGWVATTDDITDQHRLRQQLEENHKRIAHMAAHDALTGLPNRSQFRERLDCAVENGRCCGNLVAILMLDLNRFKQVNDTFGHPMGDQLLAAVASRLQGGIRTGETAARLGGDEFAVIIPTLDSVADAELLAQRLLDIIASPYDLSAQRVEIGTSIGIAVAQGVHVDAELLIKNADVALYAAKASGGNCFRVFTAEDSASNAVRAA